MGGVAGFDLLSLVHDVSAREPALIAVDGLAGSGKSSFTADLAAARVGRALSVVAADEFYGPEQRPWRDWTPEQGHERYFEHTRLEEQVLAPLRAHQPALYQRYDWHRRQLGKWVEVQPSGTVIVEGVYLLRPRLRQYWDACIWVDAPRDVRERRLRERGEHDVDWIERWMQAEDHYEQLDLPRQAADYIVSGV